MFGEYIPSNSGTVDTLTLSDGRQIQVSAVDGDSPYIVSGNASNSNFVQAVRSNPAFSRQDPQQVEFIEYARGMDGQSAGPQYSGGSSRGVSKSSSRTSGSRRRQADSRFGGGYTARPAKFIEYARGMDGQSAGPQGSGSQDSGTQYPRKTVTGTSRRYRSDVNKNIARQMLTSIAVLSQKSVNAFLALRALHNRSQDTDTARTAQGEANLTRNLISAVNANMNNPAAIANFIRVVGPEKISRLQNAYNHRKNSILSILYPRSNPRDEYGYAEGHRCTYRDEDGDCIDHLYAQGQQQERQERQEQARQERQRQQAQRDRVAQGRQIRDSRSSKGQGSRKRRQSRRSQPNMISRSSGSRTPKRYLNHLSQMNLDF